MKRTLIAGMTVATVALSLPAMADGDHHGKGQSGAPMAGMMQGGQGMMDMSAMHGQMVKMHEIMDKIHHAKSTAERRKLMREHMKAMHKGMGMMQGMMSGRMPGGMDGQHQGAMMKGSGGMPDVEALQQRLDMMQGMMGQMMEHMLQQHQMDDPPDEEMAD
ncbi:MAG TPA: hypothetical protein ENJ19_07040 [Gammaproteobacteria bacterium]|nr:hypothetical protein [Gammaproteobacteria bacterium]